MSTITFVRQAFSPAPKHAQPQSDPVFTSTFFLTSHSIATGTPSGVSTVTAFLLPSSTSSAAKPTPIAAIAGGAVGGFLFLALPITLFLLRRRRFWRSSNNNSLPSSVTHRRTGTLSIDPFTSMTTAALAGATKSTIEAVPTPLVSANETSGVHHASETKQRLSLPSPGPPAPLSALLEERVLPQDNGGGGSTDRTAVAGASAALEGRMQHIQNLVLELNREMESVQVAVLRGRIAEPIGEDVETGARDAWNIRRESVATGTTIPPPYEPRQE